MKPLFLFLFLLGGVGFLQAQVPKMPLIEHFTQASCGPCASQNPVLKQRLDNFGTANYVRISHQVSWPGVDPMYSAYPAGPDDRRGYYGITAVPNTSLNGGAPGNSGTIITSATLSSAAAQTTPYQLEVVQSWISGDSLQVDIKVKNTTSAAISSADRLRVAMIEDHVQYATAPGSNGETEFEYVLRMMYDPSTGSASTEGATIGSIPANDSLMYSFLLTGTSIPSYIRDLNEVSFAAFLQNNSTKAIEQANKSQSGNVPGLLDVSTQSASTVGAGYCNTAFDPAISFTNNGADPITTVTAEYSIDGGTAVSQTFSGNLAQGQSTTITFPQTNIAAGTSTVSYAITDVNNGGTVSGASISIPDDVYSKLPAISVQAPVTEGFESAPLISGTGYSTDVAAGIFDSPVAASSFSVLDGPTYNYGAIGGFAQSDRNIRFRFFVVNAGEELNFVMNKLDVPANAQLTFSHTYRQYSAENDRLQVQASTDCGATWNTLWDKAGTQLATLPAATAQYVPELATEWVSNTVDLSSLANTNEVVIRFKGTSDYGNNLFIDDINISVATSTEELAAMDTEVRIMPNPVHNQMTVEFDLPESTTLDMMIFNALGQPVEQIATGTFEGMNSLSVNTSNLAAGMYFLKLVTDKGMTTKRFIVKR